MLRGLGSKVDRVPNWWLEPILAALLFALVVGTSIGYDIPPHAWAATTLICIGASLSAVSPWFGATLTLIGLLSQLTVDPRLLGPSGLVIAVHVFAAVRLRLRIVPSWSRSSAASRSASCFSTPRTMRPSKTRSASSC